MSNQLQALIANREALLLAEVAGWLHDMGKCDEKHLEINASDYSSTTSYDPYTAHSNLVRTSHQLDLQKSLLIPPIRLKDLVELDRPLSRTQDTNLSWLVRVLARCHLAAHLEKEEDYLLRQQMVADTRRGNPFGKESPHLTGLEDKLINLPFDKILDRSAFRPAVKKAFSYAIGDSRRPDNEVSLWDWTDTVAALYKSSLAAALLGNKEDPMKLKWRLLSLRFDGLTFSSNVGRIPDLVARQKVIENALDRVRELLEETYPLGTQLYQDGNGSIFIVPNIPDLLERTNSEGATLAALLQTAFSS